MIFEKGQFIKHRFSNDALIGMGLRWLADNPQPIKIVLAAGRAREDCAWEVIYHFVNPENRDDTWGIWGKQDDFYQDNECRTLE